MNLHQLIGQIGSELSDTQHEQVVALFGRFVSPTKALPESVVTTILGAEKKLREIGLGAGPKPKARRNKPDSGLS